MPSRPLEGEVALVTGANHGIGAAIAVEMSRLGASVLATYLRPSAEAQSKGTPSSYDAQRQQGGEEVANLVKRQGGRCIAVEADLSDPGTPISLFDTAEQLGPVSILVNNASGWRQDTFSGQALDGFGRPMGSVSDGSFDANFGVDALAAALLIMEFARRHRRYNDAWGRIVSLCSGGPSGFPNEVSYGAAKAALESYTMSAASELAREGITANVLYPPITDTGWVTDKVRELAESAGSHVAKPADVAEVVGWLCTEAARHVTGNRIRMR